jgi:VIT1/CCC1 family predicted Fe2+/Mn2+ transporter
MKSNFLRLNTSDLVKGFVVAFLSASLTGIINTLDSGMLPLLSELKQAGIVGLTAGLSYLLKNLLTNSEDELMKKEA